METAEIQASLQSPLFSRLDEDGDRPPVKVVVPHTHTLANHSN